MCTGAPFSPTWAGCGGTAVSSSEGHCDGPVSWVGRSLALSASFVASCPASIGRAEQGEQDRSSDRPRPIAMLDRDRRPTHCLLRLMALNFLILSTESLVPPAAAARQRRRGGRSRRRRRRTSRSSEGHQRVAFALLVAVGRWKRVLLWADNACRRDVRGVRSRSYRRSAAGMSDPASARHAVTSPRLRSPVRLPGP